MSLENVSELTDAERLRLTLQVEVTSILENRAQDEADWFDDMWALVPKLRDRRAEERELRTALGRSLRRALVRLVELDGAVRASRREWAPVFAAMLKAEKEAETWKSES